MAVRPMWREYDHLELLELPGTWPHHQPPNIACSLLSFVAFVFFWWVCLSVVGICCSSDVILLWFWVWTGAEHFTSGKSDPSKVGSCSRSCNWLCNRDEVAPARKLTERGHWQMAASSPALQDCSCVSRNMFHVFKKNQGHLPCCILAYIKLKSRRWGDWDKCRRLIYLFEVFSCDFPCAF